jgi:hypothetical protein
MSDNETRKESEKPQTSVKCKKIGDYILGNIIS